MTDHNPEHVEKILNDLPEVQRIALRPWQGNPLLAPLLTALQSLNEIATWAGAASQLAQEPPAPADAPLPIKRQKEG